MKIKHFKPAFLLLAVLLFGCGHRTSPSITQYAAVPVEEAADQSQSNESDEDDDDDDDGESHYLWNSKSTFRITYNNNRPIHGFRVHCEGTQYFYDNDRMYTDFNLVFTNAKTDKSFRVDNSYFSSEFDRDSIISPNLSLTYKEGKSCSDGDDLFWFVDLDFDGNMELLTDVVTGAGYHGIGFFRKIYRIVNDELIDATQEFIAKNKLFDGYVERERFAVNSLRREIIRAAGTWGHGEFLIYTYEEDGTYRLDRYVLSDCSGSCSDITIESPQKDTLRRYEFTFEEYNNRLKNIIGFGEI